LLRERPREVVFGFLSITGHNANVYILNAFALSYLTATIGFDRSDALIGVMLAAITVTITAPLFGHLTDKIGYRKVFVFGAAFAAVFAFPFFALLSAGSMLWATVAMMISYGLGFGAMAGAQGLFLSNLFPTRYRFTGIAFTREMNGALVAGPTPFIATALVIAAGGSTWLVASYVMVCCVLSIVGVVFARSRKTEAELDESML